MPTTTTHGIVKPAAGTEPADMYGVTTRLADSTDAAIAPTAWTAPTLTGSWVNYGTTYQVAQYRKRFDEVSLRGAVKNGSTGSGSPIFTLPAGFRPPADLAVATYLADLVIDTAGKVYVAAYISGGTNSYVSIDVTFSITA